MPVHMFLSFSFSKTGNDTKKGAKGNIKALFSACTKKEGFLSPEELRYWNDNFKLPHHEAGLTPSKTTPRCRLGPPPPELSLTEWTAWQTPLQHFHFVNHSKRCRNFTEILEFCDFRRDCGDDEDSYELEMQSFLNPDDIPQPGQRKAEPSVSGNVGKNKHIEETNKNCQLVVNDGADDRVTRRLKDGGIKRKSADRGLDTDDGNGDGECSVRDKNGGHKNEGNRDMNKTKGAQRKRKSGELGSDTDDDEHAICGKKSNILRNKNGRTSMHVTKENSHDMCDNDSESNRMKKSLDVASDIVDDFEDHFDQRHYENVLSAPKKRSDPGTSYHESKSKSVRSNPNSYLQKIKNQMKEEPSRKEKTTSHSAPCFIEDHSELPRERNDKHPSSDNDLSDLLDIPSSLRQRKDSRVQRSNVLKPDGVLSDILPDAPSLDTLLDLSIMNTGELQKEQSDVEHGSSDNDYFPSMYPETPKTSKVETHIHNVCGPVCDKVGLKGSGMSGMGGMLKKPTKTGVGDKTCHGSMNLSGSQELRALGSTKEGEKTIEASLEANNKDGVSVASNFKEKPIRKGKFQVTDKGNSKLTINDGNYSNLMAARKCLSEEESTAFGSGLVCDSSPDKAVDDTDSQLYQQFANSFNDDNAEEDRPVCCDESPCLFDDGDAEDGPGKLNEKRLKQTSKSYRKTSDNLRYEDESYTTNRNNFHSPCLFDDDIFENVSESNSAKISRPNCSSRHSSPKRFAESKNTLRVDDEFENENTLDRQNKTKCLSRRSLFSEFDDLGVQKTDCAKGVDDKLTANTLRRRPLLEHNIDSKITDTSVKSTRVAKCPLDRVKLFSFAQPKPDKSMPLKETISKELGEYIPDVLAPSPNVSLLLGKSIRSRTFRGNSCLMRSVCGQKGEGVNTLEIKERTPKLKSKEIRQDPKSKETLECSSFRQNTLSDKQQTDQTLEVIPTKNFTDNVSPKKEDDVKCLSDKTKKDEDPSAFAKSTFPMENATKTQNTNELPIVTASISFQRELKNEDLNIRCLSAALKTNSSFSCKDGACMQDGHSHCKYHVDGVDILNEQSFKISSKADEKSTDEDVTSYGDQSKSDFEGESTNGSGADSPLVIKAKWRVKSKTAGNKQLESDKESGAESSDCKGQIEEERETTKGVESDYQEEGSLVTSHFVEKQTKEVHEIYDTDDEFDLPQRGELVFLCTLIMRNGILK